MTMEMLGRTVARAAACGAIMANLACGGQESARSQNPCDSDALYTSVNICLVPASDEDRRGTPVTPECYWLNKAIGQKRLHGLNAEGIEATYDVYVYNYCDVPAEVELSFPDDDIECANADASGAIPVGTVPPDGKPRRGTCRALAYAYEEDAPARNGRYALKARIGTSVGTYDPEVILERAGEPPSRPAVPPPPVKPPVP